jgi:hypothetical protein
VLDNNAERLFRVRQGNLQIKFTSIDVGSLTVKHPV